MRIVSLGTEEVIELFYKLFNPGELEKPLQVTQIATITYMALFDFLKPKTPAHSTAPVAPILPEQIYKEGVLELQDVIAPSALKITPREINLGDKIARTFFVMSYPRMLTDSWFAPVINLDRVLDISIFIHPIDSAEILKKFQKKVAEVQSQIMSREEKGLVRDPILDTAYQDLEDLRDQLQQAQEKLFSMSACTSPFTAKPPKSLTKPRAKSSRCSKAALYM